MPTYEQATFKIEDYDWRDQDCILTVEAEFSVEASYPASSYDPPESGEVEVESFEVTGALVGADQTEACPAELALIQKHFRANPEAMQGLWERCASIEA